MTSNQEMSEILQRCNKCIKELTIEGNIVPFSIISNFSISSLMSIGVDLLGQSYVQTRASTINGVREVRKSSRMRPLVLKADSDAIVEIGIARTSRAN
jgi:hypothetical protein